MSGVERLAWIVVPLALGTYLLRLSFLGLLSGGVPPAVRRTLRFVPAAALCALIVPATLAGPVDGAVRPERLIALAAAAIVVARTRHVVLTIATGMGTLWLVQALR